MSLSYLEPVLRRLALAPPVLWGASLLTFLVVNRLPGSVAQQLLRVDASPEQIASLRAELGLDRPVWVRYWEWLAAALHGDLGTSLASQQPVTTLVAEQFPVTLELVLYSLVLAVGLAILLALAAARKPGGALDRITLILSMGGLSCASYVLALVFMLVFAVRLGWFPSIGFVPLEEGLWRNIRSLTLPAVAIAIPLWAFYTRFLRADLLEQIRSQDYVVAALAKGLSPWHVLTRHVLRNSLFGLLTVVGLNMGTLIGGTVIIEQIFALPGIGRLLLQAIALRDIVVIQGIVLLLAAITMLANLAVDGLYSALDPRIRVE